LSIFSPIKNETFHPKDERFSFRGTTFICQDYFPAHSIQDYLPGFAITGLPVPVYFQRDFFGNYAGDFIGGIHLDAFSH
jgi:hypothetical protein